MYLNTTNQLSFEYKDKPMRLSFEKMPRVRNTYYLVNYISISKENNLHWKMSIISMEEIFEELYSINSYSSYLDSARHLYNFDLWNADCYYLSNSSSLKDHANLQTYILGVQRHTSLVGVTSRL